MLVIKIAQDSCYFMDVAIIGLGSLGSVTAKRLGKIKGVNLRLYDRDYVEFSNLSRQPFYDKADVGKTKSEAAASKLKNSESFFLEVTKDSIKQLGKPDILICLTDSMENKFLVNDYCKKSKIKTIFGSAIEERAMIFVNDESCFRCAFLDAEEESCDISGISIDTAKTVARIISEEVIKIKAGKKSSGLIYTNKNKIQRIRVKKSKNCEACSKKYIFLKKKIEKISRICGGSYIIRARFDFSKLKGTRFNDVVHIEGNSFFSDGRAFIKAKNEKDAIKIFNSLIQNQ